MADEEEPSPVQDPEDEEPLPDEMEDPDEDPPPEEDEEAPDDVDVEEHLKDAVDGSLRLKRLLSADAGGATKKRKTDEISPEIKTKVESLLRKWGLATNTATRHTLGTFRLEELEMLEQTRYVPPKGDAKRSPSEQLAYHLINYRERKLPGGGGLDCVGSFKFRWKLNADQERTLRELSHKDLRYVVMNFDGNTPLEDVISEATCEEPGEDLAIYAMPTAPGPKAMSRFNRLELIDPMADAAVFGDANLTFSLILAAHRAGLGHVGRVIATTFEEIETLRERYKEIDESIKTLEDHDAEVYHGVDCTRIAIDSRFKGMENTIGAVYYNFPHSGAIKGFFDGNPMVNWRHENLMRLFFRALRFFVKPGGVVKVSSSKGAVGVRYSYIVGGALENEFEHVETMPLLEWCLHRYGRSYGDRRDLYKRPDAKNNQSYDAQNQGNDMVYCFRYAPTGKTLGPQEIRLPPSLECLENCDDGAFAKVHGAQKKALAAQLHERFLMEVTGTHVG